MNGIQIDFGGVGADEKIFSALLKKFILHNSTFILFNNSTPDTQALAGVEVRYLQMSDR